MRSPKSPGDRTYPVQLDDQDWRTRLTSADPRPPSTGPYDPLPWYADRREGVLMGEVLGVSPSVCRARWSELSAEQAHGLARLRIDVLVAETSHAYRELDDLDLDPGTEHLWVPDGNVPVAYLRVIRDVDAVRIIDRACARADIRQLGLVGALITEVVACHGAGPLRALAQAETVSFFLHHGFEPVGETVDTPAGPRLPMRRHPETPWRD